MALQHFYSRVPAKISMYNRTDSFDTFICSAGVSRDFALKELAQVNDLKLTVHEIETKVASTVLASLLKEHVFSGRIFGY